MKNLVKMVLMILTLSVFSNVWAMDNNPENLILRNKIRNGKKSILSTKEFATLNDFQKKLVTQIDVAAASLDIYKKNNLKNYQAIVNYNMTSKEFFTLLSASDTNGVGSEGDDSGNKPMSCTACGKLDAIGCYNKINDSTSNQKSFTVTVTKLDNGCTKLTWTVQTVSTSTAG